MRRAPRTANTNSESYGALGGAAETGTAGFGAAGLGGGALTSGVLALVAAEVEGAGTADTAGGAEALATGAALPGSAGAT